MTDTGTLAALSATPNLFGRILSQVKGLGLSLRDWGTGETARRRQAAQVVSDTLKLEPATAALSDTQLKSKTADLKARLQAGASLDEIQAEAFAVAREAARRATGLLANDKQLLGAAYAHQGAIVDMKTGEGKTLMAVMPAYLHALTGQGVHILTANDYLAQRDRDQMGPVFERLGLSAAAVTPDMTLDQAQGANGADICYGTVAAFGFQYLKDHLALDPSRRVGRDLSQVYALVDEADKVMLDDANTPLIISDSLPENPRPIQVMATVLRHLQSGKDYESEPKDHQAWLTEAGLERVEKLLAMGDLYSEKNQALVPYLHAAVQAQALYHEGVDYLKQDGQIVLIDPNTGRPKPGHRFAEGLHQAIEAKENMAIGAGMLTLGSVTAPNYLRMYGQLAGMTGTGLASRPEFEKTYGMSVQTVPTHKPTIRQELPDLMFDDCSSRDRAMVDHVAGLHRSGRPVLLGTGSIERSEELSRMLQQQGIPHQLLNARNLAAEADIVAQAGRLGAVTIATDMAGRGTDIKLGGDPSRLGAEFKLQCANEKAQVVALGGLAVVGSERHQARRVDEQLAGRAGRQGDPGSSQFWLSREDELFRFNLDDQERQLPAAEMVLRAQEHSENRCQDQRDQTQKYDNVANLQRQAVYEARDAVLDGADVAPSLSDYLDQVSTTLAERLRQGELTREQVQQEVNFLLSPDQPVEIPQRNLSEWLKSRLAADLDTQRRKMGPAFQEVLRPVYLDALDREWIGQMSELEALRDGNPLEAGDKENPIIDYELKAHQAFETFLSHVATRTIHGILAARPVAAQQP